MKRDTKKTELLERLERFRREEGLYREGDSLLVALSGGKDSVCLLRLLAEQRERLGLKLFAVHLHHGLRETADRDLAFCRELCRRLEIPFVFRQVDCAAEAKKRGLGVEETGRKLRYEFFREVCRQRGCDRIVTAHSASDQSETVLMNLTRGATLGGLCGIPVKRGEIIRPLLCLSSEEILFLLRQWEQEFAEDESNAHACYRRNRLRRRVLPLLKEENPALDATLQANTRILRGQKRLLDRLCDRALEGISSPDGLRTDRERLRRLCGEEDIPALFSRVIERACKSLGAPLPPGERMEALTKAALFAGAGKRVQFTGGELLVGQRELVFSHGQREKALFRQELLPGENRISPIGALLIRGEEKNGNNYKNINKMLMIMKINSATIKGALVARNREAGDKIRINGMSKSVKKLICDGKFPGDRRDRLPVVADEEGILWIPGIGLCDRARPLEGKAYLTLELRWDEAEA